MKNNAMTPSIFAFILSALSLIISPLSFAANNNSKTQNERWFEIEVILFKQITSASENSEVFSPVNLSNKKQRALDLLTPYLQPNIATLKQLLPYCEQTETTSKKSTYSITTLPLTLWVDNVSPVRIDHTEVENLNGDLIASSDKTENNLQHTTTIDRQGIKEQQPEEHNYQRQPADSPLNNAVFIENSEEAYQQEYTNITLENYSQYPTTIDKGTCIIPSEVITKHLSATQLKTFNVDSFPIEKHPVTINGLEQWQEDEKGEITWASHSPYLISQDSLQLKSIARSIKRSRNYTSLLHLGWRQVGQSKRKAKAMRLYAGENLSLDYQQALIKQNDEQRNILAQEEALLIAKTLNNSQVQSRDNMLAHNQPLLEVDKITLAKEKLRQNAQQQQLNTLFAQYANLEKAENDINQLESKTKVERVIAGLSADIGAPKITSGLNLAITESTIKAPVQPWSLDGLFKVHLDHYLYINSEFNISDNNKKTTTQLSNQKLPAENNIITFKQDRRVITGEIHYFDHPNMGMIVQIRRFDPTKPASEAVTQAKK